MTSTTFDDIDHHIDNYEGDKALDLLLEKFGKDTVNVAALERLAHATYIHANSEEDATNRNTILSEGRNYALRLLKQEPESAKGHKWAATLTGVLASNADSNQARIKLGHEFKFHLDKAIQLMPDEATLLHMRGRFFYEVAGMSLIERTLAAVFFGSPPSATYEEALADFLKMEERAPGALDNYLYIGKCYHKLGKLDLAREFLVTVLKFDAVDAVDQEHIQTAFSLLHEIDPDFAAEDDDEEDDEDGDELDNSDDYVSAEDADEAPRKKDEATDEES